MLDARRRPVGRFFCGLGTLLLVWWGLMQAPSANAADAGVATTHVSDTVYACGYVFVGSTIPAWIVRSPQGRGSAVRRFGDGRRKS